MVAILTEKNELVMPPTPMPRTCPWGACPKDETSNLCCRSCDGLGICNGECGKTLLLMCSGRA